MKKIALGMLLALAVVTSGCIKEKTIEKQIVAERQASENINDSVNVTGLAGQKLTVTKKSLGKAFILIPSLRTTGKQPQLSYLRPLIISFERMANRLALFNLTDAQLYSTIPAQRLLQSFNIISENETSITFDLGQGFTSLSSDDNLGVVEKTLFKKLLERIQTGESQAIDVKESVVRSVQLGEDSLQVEQFMRIATSTLEKVEKPFEKNDALTPELVHREITVVADIEIKPYLPDPKFASKVFDNQERIGYFLNFAVKEQEDEPVPQITYWNMSEEKGPIQVILIDKTPAEVVEAIKEGVYYWNKVIGRDVLQFSTGFQSQLEYQKDRSIVIYWIPWDSAGFAQANFQADPLTGEIFRGQVFMTSSWLKHASILGDIPLKSPEVFLQLPSKCVLDQKRLQDFSGILHFDQQKATSMTMDTIRNVVAHEMGHALGLRHNFAGSSTNKESDADIIKGLADYVQTGDAKVTSSTSIMDYTDSIETALIGNYIKKSALSYDQAAIDWAYLGKPVTLDKNNYCSDEHIAVVDAEDKKIYACNRFDSLKNQALARTYALVHYETNRIGSEISKMMRVKAYSKSHYTQATSIDALIQGLNLSSLDLVRLTDLRELMYKKPSDSYYSISTILGSYLSAAKSGYSHFYETGVDSQVNADSKAVGGYSGILKKILSSQEKANGKLYVDQVDLVLSQANPTLLKDTFTDEQLVALKNKLNEQATLADQKFVLTVLKALPLENSVPVKSSVVTDGKVTTQSTMEIKPISDQFDIGKIEDVLEIYQQEYKKSLEKRAVKLIVNGTEMNFLFPEKSATEDTIFLKAPLKGTAWTMFRAASFSTQLKTNKETYKTLSVQNTLKIIQALGAQTPEPLTSASLEAVLKTIDPAQLTPEITSEINNELRELKQIEAIP